MAGSNSNNALGLFNIKDSLQGGRCFIETGFAAAGGGSRALHFCQCVSGGVWQHTSAAATGKQLPRFLSLCIPLHSHLSPAICVAKQTSRRPQEIQISKTKNPKLLLTGHHVNKQIVTSSYKGTQTHASK